MSTFNRNSRIKNILISSAAGVIEQLFVYLFEFIFRTVFLYFLSKSFLGISGLFTNILQIFSLTELGIGSVIAYRLYEPIKNSDIEKCHALIDFYKKIYRLMGLSVAAVGVLVYPFLSFFIADTSEVPSDVNLKIIYWLFVFQSVSSYFFVYSQSLLSSDQKNYIISFANTLYRFFFNAVKIVILIITKDYTLSLASGILINFIYNLCFYLYIHKNYSFIFRSNGSLTKTEKKNIFKDTGALLCHKVGYVILNSTDNLILSKFIGIVTLAIYSNYALIATAIDALLNKLLGSFISSIGNLCLENNKDDKNKAYESLQYLNFFLVSFCSVCFFCLINPFITIWLDESYLLPTSTITVISLNMFFNSTGIVNCVFINANGLFVKDKIRPLIQALINLVVSIALVRYVGITGVFIGTLVSVVLTSWWRQPFLVYKYILGKNVWLYYLKFTKWLISSICVTLPLFWVLNQMPNEFHLVVIKLIICILTVPLFLLLINYNSAYIRNYKDYLVLLKNKG